MRILFRKLMKNQKLIRPGAKKAINLRRRKSTKKAIDREPPKSPIKFIGATEQFFSDIDVLSEAFRTVMPVLEEKDKQQQKILETAIAKLTRATEALAKGRVQGRVDTQALETMGASVLQVASGARKLHRASSLYRRHALVLLVALLDDFTGAILGITFNSKRELLHGSDKTVPVEEALAATSLDDLVAKIVATETDKILRMSYASQIEYLDRKFKLGLRESFAGYADFIEVVERRHLFVHTGGRVSGQYLEACYCAGKALKVDRESVLGANNAYLTAAEELIFEYALRLSQALFRRLFPQDLEYADKAIIDYGVHLLVEQRWERARKVFSFAHNIPEKLVANDALRRIFLVNLAIALQGLGREEEALQLLGSIDWSSAHPRFSIVVAVLRGKYTEAAGLMRRNRDAMSESDYREWPVFRQFRTSEEFQKTFNEVFGKQFIPEVPTQTQITGSQLTWVSRTALVDPETNMSASAHGQAN